MFVLYGRRVRSLLGESRGGGAGMLLCDSRLLVREQTTPLKIQHPISPLSDRAARAEGIPTQQ